MKKISTFLALLPVASAVYGQVVIHASDMPVPTTSYNVMNMSATSAPNPLPGASATWNYSGYLGTAATRDFYTETDTFFTNVGVDVYTADYKSMAPGFGYNLWSELDFSASGVNETGISIPRQVFDLSAVTGNSDDSLVVPAQNARLSSPRTIVAFPFSYLSSWSTVSHRSVDFTITAIDYFLINTPGKHNYNVYRKDTILGWGKMTVRSASGPSVQYDVVLDRIAQYATDSFYLGGSPAPATLLSNFGVSQGQATDSSYWYTFYRPSSFNYLVQFSYGADASYTTVARKFYDADNIVPANVGVEPLSGSAISTIVFPNPASGGGLNVVVSGCSKVLSEYVITDITGRVVQSGSVTQQKGAVYIALSNALTTGSYYVTLLDTTGSKVVTEQFEVKQ